jgi:hypothetical protein
MDPSTVDWQRNVVDAGVTLASHGVDLIQLDGLPWTKPQSCYSGDHGHPPGGGGTWQANAWLDLLPRFRSAVLASKSDAVISGEGGSELFLPWLDMVHSRDNWFEVTDPGQAALGADPIPLFEYVYHPWIAFLGEHNLGFPGDDTAAYHRLALARMLTWGQIADYNPWIPINSPQADAAAYAFLREIVAARSGFARSFLVGGSMLPPPAVDSPVVQVRWRLTSGQSDEAAFPAIQHSAWRAADGTVGIVMTNISNAAVRAPVSIRLQDLGLGSTGPYTVRIVSGAQSTTVAADVSGDSSYIVEVPSLKVLVVTVSR